MYIFSLTGMIFGGFQRKRCFVSCVEPVMRLSPSCDLNALVTFYRCFALVHIWNWKWPKQRSCTRIRVKYWRPCSLRCRLTEKLIESKERYLRHLLNASNVIYHSRLWDRNKTSSIMCNVLTVLKQYWFISNSCLIWTTYIKQKAGKYIRHRLAV